METQSKIKHTQNLMILRALQLGERLTSIDILNRFNSWRASARIYDLRKAGWTIETNIISTKSHKHVAEYFMLPVNRNVNTFNK
jgi:hypothetical protein